MGLRGMTTQTMTTQDQSVLDYGMLVILAAIWGGSFMFIKVAVDTVPPITITAGRLAIAAIFLYITARMAGQNLPRDKDTWFWAFVIAVIGNAVPFTLIGWGEKGIDSGLASILMAIVPICTLIMVHFTTEDEKLSLRRVIGIIVGFTGVVFLIGADALQNLGEGVLYQLAVASGAICYGISSIVNKKLSHKPDRRATAATIMIASCVFAIPASLVIDQPWMLNPTVQAIGSIVALGVLSTALAQIILLRIVKVRGAAFLSLNNYMVPLFGLLWGMLFLGEEPQSTAFIGLGLILSGIAVSRKR